MCFTPRDCWGPKRIKIEGSASAPKPTGGKQYRDGFFLHGGNPVDAVSSDCVKSLDDDVFTHIRNLTGTKGRVRFCVGSACPSWVAAALASGVITLPEITIVGDPSAADEGEEEGRQLQRSCCSSCAAGHGCESAEELGEERLED